ncbi:Rha family transcriptional regulator [Methylorubrum thiocyanatum]|uniref:Rha family transcriptional regulator n=1 Tax=Methylorubrum thiocyanatum TaxID=47958 RepID=UPI00398C4E5A
MSSLEIAERTGKEHFNVLIDIRKMLKSLGLTDLVFQASYRDATGRSLPCFNLPKRECMILVSGYSIPLRAAMIKRSVEREGRRCGATQPQCLPRHRPERRGC